MKKQADSKPITQSSYCITDECKGTKEITFQRGTGKSFSSFSGSKYFKGKAIYNPSGKAGEYSTWACNFFTGCSNKCSYCYCKNILRGIWTDYPRLKTSLKSESNAIQIFKQEMANNLPELQKNGLFFSFTTDPTLDETIYLTNQAAIICAENKIKVKILTKDICWMQKYGFDNKFTQIGFTLTGHDELEHSSAGNIDRIRAMLVLHDNKFKTFASIEPIIDLKSSLKMIRATDGFCDLYKIGLMSGKKYEKKDLFNFIDTVIFENPNTKIYFKNSLLDQAGVKRDTLPANCVNRNYNLN